MKKSENNPSVLEQLSESDKAPVDLSRRLKHRMMRFLLISLFGAALLYSGVFAPAYVYTSTDVLYKSSALPEVLEFGMSLCEIFSFGVFYGVLIYAVYRFSFRSVIPFCLGYVFSLLFKYISNLVFTWVTDGVPERIDFLSVFLNFATELFQAGIVLLFTWLVFSSWKKRRAPVAKRARHPEPDPVFPLRKLISFQNPIEKAAFLAASVPAAMRVLSRILYDIGYGAPTGLVDFLWMVLYYGMDIAGYGILVYFLVLFIEIRLDLRESAWKTEGNEKTGPSLSS